MFSVNGLYFDRSGDGSVVVTVKVDDAENAITVRDVTIDAASWAQLNAEVGTPQPRPGLATIVEDELIGLDERGGDNFDLTFSLPSGKVGAAHFSIAAAPPPAAAATAVDGPGETGDQPAQEAVQTGSEPVPSQEPPKDGQ
jgi:hypothetical protein